ncbi:MAG: hypothetical protein OIF50_02985 [Flavobacteriaceae bacterium]|nr:hypothetical protein [Flavobacteriaceae bacterium]
MSDLDTDQVEDLVLHPILEASLIRLEIADIEASAGPLPIEVSDFLEYDGFQSGFVPNHLIRADIFFEFENSTAKIFQARIEFLNGNGQILDSQLFDIQSAVNTTPFITNRTITYEGEQISVITNTQIIRITASTNALPPSVIDNAKLEFKMSGKLYLEIE